MGKFEENGRSGYVLKPLVMTSPKKTMNPFDILPIEDVVPLRIAVQVPVAGRGRLFLVKITRTTRSHPPCRRAIAPALLAVSPPPGPLAARHGQNILRPHGRGAACWTLQ